MSTLVIAPAARQRLSLLIPRLASDHDGEVVATARAIGRTLHGSGADWHDLAASVVRNLPASSSQGDPDEPSWNGLGADARAAWLAAAADCNALSDWEASFIGDIQRRLQTRGAYFRFSDRQIDVIDRILAKAFAAGVTP